MQLRVLYAGDMEFARAQFASSARQLTLIPITEVLGAFGGGVGSNGDVAVIDCAAPGINASSMVQQVRGMRLSIPIVLVIDPSVENGASTALGLQADDYTVKTPGWLARLPVRLQIVVSRHRRIKQLEGTGQAERLRMAVERAPVCLARVLSDGIILAANDAAMSMLGTTALEDVLRKPLSTFVASKDAEALTEFLTTVCRGEARSVEVSITPTEGNERIMELSATALPEDASGRASAIVAMRDVTERRRLEASVLEVAGSDAVAEHVEKERLEAELADLQRRFDEAQNLQHQLTEARDADRRAADAAASENARLNALLAERDGSSAAANAELERVYQDARTQLEDASKTLEHERQQAATRLKDAAGDLQHERERREAAEQKLDADERRLFDAVVARDSATARLAELSAERDAHLGRIQELERTVAESKGGDASALEEARAEREGAERRSSELEARMAADRNAAKAVSERCATLEAEHQRMLAEIAQLTMDRHASEAQAATRLNAEISKRESAHTKFGALESELARAETQRRELEGAVARAVARVRELEDVVAGANSAHAAEMAAATSARAALARAVEERDAMRAELDAERHRHHLTAASPPVTDASGKEAMVREQSARIDVLTERLNQSEAACRRAVAERDERERAFQALQAELNQFIELRRSHRQELVAALNDALKFEELATQQMQKVRELEQALRAAKTEFDELTTWASARSAKLNEGFK